MIWRRAVGLLSVAAVTLLGLSAVPASAATSTTSTSGVSIVISSIAPAGTLDPRHGLTVKGTLRNSGPALSNLVLRLRLDDSVLDTRDRIDSWVGVTSGTTAAGTTAAGTTGSADDATRRTTTGAILPGSLKIKTFAAGARSNFILTVSPGQLGLSNLPYAYGPRGLTVQLAHQATELAATRTVVVWNPDGAKDTPAQLSLLVPITGAQATTDAGAADTANAELLAANGRLTRVLAAARDPAVDWAIDPAVIQAAHRLETGGVTESAPAGSAATPSGGTTSSTGTSSAAAPGTASSSVAPGQVSPQEQQETDARSWLTTLTAGQSQRVVVGLPYADPDLNSILDNKQPGLLKEADTLGKAVLNANGVKADRTIAWPGDGKVSSRTIAGLIRLKRSDVVLAAGSQPTSAELSYTPTGRSVMRSGKRQLGGLLYDEQLSALLTASGGSTSATSTQLALAELAAIGMQAPDGQTTQVLAVAPRDWNPDPIRVGTLLSALHSAPYVSLQSLTSLRAADGSAVDRDAPQYSRASRDQELVPGQMTSVARLNDGLGLLEPAVVNADADITALRERVVSLLSMAWRSRSADEAYQARLDVSKVVTPVANGVKLIRPSTSWFTAKSSVLTAYVQNKTPYTVRGTVRLTPRSGQLKFEGPVSFTVQPGETEPVQVKTTTEAGGDITVEARLFTPAGQQLVATQTFLVHVRPNWERIGMIVAGSILGLLFLIGLLRSIRRGRPRVPPHTVPDVDDIATASDPRTGQLDAAEIAQRSSEREPVPAGPARVPDRPDPEDGE